MARYRAATVTRCGQQRTSGGTTSEWYNVHVHQFYCQYCHHKFLLYCGPVSWITVNLLWHWFIHIDWCVCLLKCPLWKSMKSYYHAQRNVDNDFPKITQGSSFRKWNTFLKCHNWIWFIGYIALNVIVGLGSSNFGLNTKFHLSSTDNILTTMVHMKCSYRLKFLTFFLSDPFQHVSTNLSASAG